MNAYFRNLKREMKPHPCPGCGARIQYVTVLVGPLQGDGGEDRGVGNRARTGAPRQTTVPVFKFIDVGTSAVHQCEGVVARALSGRTIGGQATREAIRSIKDRLIQEHLNVDKA